ncbi:MAG: peptidase S41 [Clostridiales bacterium]|nr:peptidase S41 [Clostridiales bacterium]
MNGIKRMSLLTSLILICFLLLSCTSTSNKAGDLKTYSNTHFQVQYPSSWMGPVENGVQGVGDNSVYFSMKEDQLSMTVKTMRYGVDFIEKGMETARNDVVIKDHVIDGNKGYRIDVEESDVLSLTWFYVQEEDISYEIKFEYQTDDYENHQSLIEQIITSFEFADFEKEYRSETIDGDGYHKWLADIDFISSQLPKYHANSFNQMTEIDFYNNIEGIKEKLLTMSDEEVIVEVSKLIASVGDAHTQLVYYYDKTYPFIFYCFEDGIYLLETTAEHSELVGSKLLSINGRDIEEIRDLYRPVISHENESWFNRKFATYLKVPEYLKGLKIIDSEMIKFEFSDGSQDSIYVQVEPSGYSDYKKNNVEMLYLKNSDKNYWYEFLEEEHVLYFNYNSCYDMEGKPYLEFNNELFDFIDENSVEYLVVDIRNNGGGSSNVLNPFFDELKKRQNLNQQGKLYVIVGKDSYSSTMLNISDFDKKTKAVFIGEPTGGRLNHYGQVQTFELSNTDTELKLSTVYFENSNEDHNTFVPDIIIEMRASDYFNNIDPVMQEILELISN